MMSLGDAFIEIQVSFCFRGILSLKLLALIMASSHQLAWLVCITLTAGYVYSLAKQT